MPQHAYIPFLLPTSVQKVLGLEFDAAVSQIIFCEMVIRLLSLLTIHTFIGY